MSLSHNDETFEHDGEGGVLNSTRAIWTIRPGFTGYFFYD